MLWHWLDCSTEWGKTMRKSLLELGWWRAVNTACANNVLALSFNCSLICHWPCKASDFNSVIINIIFQNIFSAFIEQKCFIFGNCIQVKNTFQMSDFISMINFSLYSSSNTLIKHDGLSGYMLFTARIK